MVRTLMSGALALSMVSAVTIVHAQTATASAARTATTATSSTSASREQQAAYARALGAARVFLHTGEFREAADALLGVLREYRAFAEKDPDVLCALGDSRIGQMWGQSDETQRWNLIHLAADAYKQCIESLQAAGSDSDRLARIAARHQQLVAQLNARRQQLAAATAAHAESVAVAAATSTAAAIGARAAAPTAQDPAEACRLLINAAIALHSAGDYEQAYPAFEAAERCAPDEPQVWFGIGYAAQVLAAHAEVLQDRLQLLKEARLYFSRYVTPPLGARKLVAHAQHYLKKIEDNIADAQREAAASLATTTSTAYVAQVAAVIEANVRGETPTGEADAPGSKSGTAPASATAGPSKAIVVPGGTAASGVAPARTSTRTAVAAAAPAARPETGWVAVSQPSDWDPMHRQRYDVALQLLANGDVRAAIGELHALRLLRPDDVELRAQIIELSAAAQYECERALLAYQEIAERVATGALHSLRYGTYLAARECAEQVGPKAIVGVIETYVVVNGAERVDPAMLALLGDLHLRDGNVRQATKYYSAYLARDRSPVAAQQVRDAFAAYDAATRPVAATTARVPSPTVRLTTRRPEGGITVEALPPPRALPAPSMNVAGAMHGVAAVNVDQCWVPDDPTKPHWSGRLVPHGDPSCPR